MWRCSFTKGGGMGLVDSVTNPWGAGALMFVIIGMLYPLCIVTDLHKGRPKMERTEYWWAWKVSFAASPVPFIVTVLSEHMTWMQGVRAMGGAVVGLLLAGAVLRLLRDRLSYRLRRTFVVLPDGKKRLARD